MTYMYKVGENWLNYKGNEVFQSIPPFLDRRAKSAWRIFFMLWHYIWQVF